MATTMKGLLKGLRYITQIFDDEKEPDMQIGLPTDVKHVAHIGSDGPSANTPSWMNDFKAPQPENEQDGSKGDIRNQATKFNTEGKNQTGGVGLQELLPPTHNEKPKHKARRKSGPVSPHDSPTRQSGGLPPDAPPKQSRRHRSSHRSMDSSSNQDSSSHHRRRHHHSVPDMEASYPLTENSGIPPRNPTSHRSTDSSNNQDSSSQHRRRHYHSVPDMVPSRPLTENSAVPPRKPTSRHRKNKGSTGGELPVKSSKDKEENGSSLGVVALP